MTEVDPGYNHRINSYERSCLRHQANAAYRNSDELLYDIEQTRGNHIEHRVYQKDDNYDNVTFVGKGHMMTRLRREHFFHEPERSSRRRVARSSCRGPSFSSSLHHHAGQSVDTLGHGQPEDQMEKCERGHWPHDGGEWRFLFFFSPLKHISVDVVSVVFPRAPVEDGFGNSTLGEPGLHVQFR